VTLDVVESCNFIEAPSEVLALLPPELQAMLPALSDDPQMTSYRQNLATLTRVNRFGRVIGRWPRYAP
jgi:hypothetical protein